MHLAVSTRLNILRHTIPFNLVLLIALIGYPAAGDYNKALAAYQTGDYASAYAIWLPEAEAGDARAQTAIGLLYYEGKGTTQNFKTAKDWLQRAADQDNPTAQYTLGVIHERGQGVELSHKEALRWYTLAATQGHARAQTNLGLLYYQGPGEIQQDLGEAALWLNRAAHQGVPQAQYLLARLFLKGQGVEQDPDKAAQWLSRAAEQGYARAQTDLATLLLQGNILKQDFQAAFRLLQSAANQSQPQGQFLLATLYQSGRGAPNRQANPVEAAFWFTLAKTLGHPRADNRLQQNLSQLTSAQRDQVNERAKAWLEANRPSKNK